MVIVHLVGARIKFSFTVMDEKIFVLPEPGRPFLDDFMGGSWRLLPSRKMPPRDIDHSADGIDVVDLPAPLAPTMLMIFLSG